MAPPNAASARRACWWRPPAFSSVRRAPSRARRLPMRWAASSAAARAIPRSSMRLWACAGAPCTVATPKAGQAVGARIARLDGHPKVDGQEAFGADASSAGCAALFGPSARPITAPRFSFGDLDAFLAANPGIVRVLTAEDIPGRNIFGVIPPFADQPVFADRRNALPRRGRRGRRRRARARSKRSISRSFRSPGEELPPVLTSDAALRSRGARLIHENRAGNILVRGRVMRGDAEHGACAGAAAVVEGEFETGFVEHAYIEPEAGWARRVRRPHRGAPSRRSRPTWTATISPPSSASRRDAVRIIPSACGGGFGSKLDLSVQPFVALAAWLTATAGAPWSIRGRNRSIVHDQAPSRPHALAHGADA